MWQEFREESPDNLTPDHTGYVRAPPPEAGNLTVTNNLPERLHAARSRRTPTVSAHLSYTLHPSGEGAPIFGTLWSPGSSVENVLASN
ncbi:hypothetical protein GCM10022198_21050 [Klugiella xanthotipulae]